MQPTHSQWLHGKYYTFISARAAAQFSSVVEKLSQFVVCLSITICVGQVAIRRIAYLLKIFVQVKKKMGLLLNESILQENCGLLR